MLPIVKKSVDPRALTETLGESRLSFESPERLMTHLGLTPGSVSPFGLINDTRRAGRLVLDAELKTAECVGCHSNTNSPTIVVR